MLAGCWVSACSCCVPWPSTGTLSSPSSSCWVRLQQGTCPYMHHDHPMATVLQARVSWEEWVVSCPDHLHLSPRNSLGHNAESNFLAIFLECGDLITWHFPQKLQFYILAWIFVRVFSTDILQNLATLLGNAILSARPRCALTKKFAMVLFFLMRELGLRTTQRNDLRDQ